MSMQHAMRGMWQGVILLAATLAPGLFAQEEPTVLAEPNAQVLQVPNPEPLALPPIPETFKHPGLSSSMEELKFVKGKIAAGEEPWKTAFEQMRKSKWADLNYKAVPHETVRSGFLGKGGAAGGAGDLSGDSNAAYTQVLMWILTDNEQYAQNAVEILKAWSILRNHEGGNWYLQASWSGAVFAEAAELLKATYPKWKKEDIARFSEMLSKGFLPVLHKQMAYGNRGLSTWYTMMAIGVFNDDRGAFYEGLAHFVSYLPSYLYLKEDGPKPKLPNYWLGPPTREELAKMDAGLFPNPADAWFSVETRNRIEAEVKAKKLGNDHSMLEKPVIDTLWNHAPAEAFVDGLCGETFRDLGHSEMSLFSISHILEMAWHQGIDLYTPNTRRVTAFMELDAFLRIGSPVPPCFYKVVPNAMGTSWEVLYNHYHNRKGMDLPHTRKVLDKVVRRCITQEFFSATKGWSHFKMDLQGIRSTGVGGFPTWETLTHGELDAKEVVPGPIKGEATAAVVSPASSVVPIPKPTPLNLPPIPETFRHPGLMSNQEELQFIKTKIGAGEEPWKTAFEAMKNSKWADLKYKAKPEAFCKDGGTQNDDALAAYTQALMWVFTGNEQYARNAEAILNGWSTLTGVEADNWYLLGTAAIFAEGAELLKATYPQWEKDDQAKFSMMLAKVYLPLLHNQMAYGSKEFNVIYAMMAIGVFNDDRGAFHEALSHLASYLPCWIYLKEDGPIPRVANYWLTTPSHDELAKLDAALFPNAAEAWFSVKVKGGADDRALLESGDLDKLWSGAPAEAYIDGLGAQMFSGKRGLGEGDVGFVGLSHALEIAWHQGVDLYTPNTKRITAFMELNALLRVSDDVPPAFYKVMPGMMTATWEAAYNHYHNRKGLDLPWTRKLIGKAVRSCLTKTPRTSRGWSTVAADDCGLRTTSILYPAIQNCAWETLTHAELGDLKLPHSREK